MDTHQQRRQDGAEHFKAGVGMRLTDLEPILGELAREGRSG